MNKGIVLVSLVLMSLAATESAFAGPGRMRFERQFHEKPAAREQRASREEERPQQNEANRPAQYQNGVPPAGQTPGRPNEAGQSGNNNPNQVQPGQFPRPGARMSAEERQKLRRQINEAGRSIYVPPAK